MTYPIDPPYKFVICKWCGTPTRNRGDQVCDLCWELKTRIFHRPGLAFRMILSYIWTTKIAKKRW